jgi:hypothetical protein
MGAIENFLRRFGYAKLDRFGLLLTGDGRVLTNRPHILDDGLGGKIVGWTDDDLAAMELEHWGAPKPQPAKRVAGKKVVQPPPRPVARPTVPTPVVTAPAPAPLPGVAPVVAAPAVVAPVVAAPVVAAPVVVAPPPAPIVAEEEPVEDDEWEWTIAMARARAAAEEVQQAATSIPKGATAPRAPMARAAAPYTPASRAPAPIAPVKRKTSPGMPAVRAKTEPPVAAAPLPKLVERKTVIPIPSLSLNGQSPLRRAPRGTGPIEDTVRTQPAPPANDDTSPYVTLPAEVKAVGHAHTKRVAAKVR